MRVALTAVLVAVVLLAVPLALAIRSTLYAGQRDTLERAALAAAVRVSPDYVSGDPVELPHAPAGGRLGLYDPRQRLRAGDGPAAGEDPVRRALAGQVVRGRSGGDLVAAVPVPHDERVIGAVRASSPVAAVRDRVLAVWAALLGVTAAAVTVAVLVARRQARVLAAPLENLSRHCRAVAEGDLNARVSPSSIAEIDQVARTHNTMLHSLSELLRRERDFTANASHQLRTPLAGLQLILEAGLDRKDARPALREALAATGRLNDTVDELLRLARTDGMTRAPVPDRPVARLVRDTEERWHGLFAQDGRRLEVSGGGRGTEEVRVPGGPVEEILAILLDNARVHGHGTVRLTVRDLDEALAFDVTDEGRVTEDPARLFERGRSTGGGSGIGLALARDLAARLGGRLSATRTDPATFTLLVPSGEQRGGRSDGSGALR